MFVDPELDPELQIAHCMTPEVLDRALSQSERAVGATAVSPTYFGAVADVRGLAEVAHSHGVPLVVDEAWGAHLAFSDDLPDHALACGADLVVSSMHKIVGSITQSAIVHLGSGDRIDEDVVDRCVTLVESTSPSSLLTGSLDAARRRAAVEGSELLAETLAGLAELRERCGRSRAWTCSTNGWWAHPACMRTTRSAWRSTCAARGRRATSSPRFCERATT